MHLEQAEIEGANVIIIIIMFERNRNQKQSY